MWNQINIIVDGKTGSSLTNAGEVRGCEEVTGWTGSLALEVWIHAWPWRYGDARRDGTTCRSLCRCREECTRFRRCGRRHANWRGHNRLSVQRRWAGESSRGIMHAWCWPAWHGGC